MPTEDSVEKIETDLKAILARLTAEHEAAKGLAVEIRRLEEDTGKLDEHVTASQKDIAVFLESQDTELDSLLAEGQQYIEKEI